MWSEIRCSSWFSFSGNKQTIFVSWKEMHSVSCYERSMWSIKKGKKGGNSGKIYTNKEEEEELRRGRRKLNVNKKARNRREIKIGKFIS